MTSYWLQKYFAIEVMNMEHNPHTAPLASLGPELEKQIISIAERYHKEPHQLMRILLDIQKLMSNAIPREAATIISRVILPGTRLSGMTYINPQPEPPGTQR